MSQSPPDGELTYDTATPEEIAEARARARRKLREAAIRWTPERWQALRESLGIPAKTS
jgi:hypothetical protein